MIIMVLGGAFLYIRTLDRDEIEEKADSALILQEEDSDTNEATELQDMEAESEPEQEELDLRVKVGSREFPLILEDSNFENFDKARLTGLSTTSLSLLMISSLVNPPTLGCNI